MQTLVRPLCSCLTVYKKNKTKAAHFFHDRLSHIISKSHINVSGACHSHVPLRATLMVVTNYERLKITNLGSFQWPNVHTKLRENRSRDPKDERGHTESIVHRVFNVPLPLRWEVG